MKKVIVGLMVLTLATALWAQHPAVKPGQTGMAGHGNLQSRLEQMEKDGWKAYKNKDAKAFRALAWPDYTAVLADGAGERTLDSTVAAMKEITILEYTLSGFRVTVIGPQSAILSYTATSKLQIGKGQPQASKMAVTDVFVKRDGAWKSIRYQETEMK